MTQAKKAYQVEKFEGEVERTKHRVNKESKTLETIVEKEGAGFMVYFPKGHSIRVKNEAELAKLGLHYNAPAFYDPETGEPTKEKGDDEDLKTVVLKATKVKDVPNPTENTTGEL